MDGIYLIIRWIHVVAVALVLGAVVFEMLLWFFHNQKGGQIEVGIIQLNNMVLWIALGIVILTGASNLGAFGEAVPNPESIWGKLFIGKMIGVAIFLGLSFIRSCRWDGFQLVSVSSQPHKVKVIQASLYIVSLFLVLGLIGAGVLLSHGV